MPLDPQQQRELAHWATEAFANGFAAAVEGMAGARPELSFETAASSLAAASRRHPVN